jgi:hypothetical protein
MLPMSNFPQRFPALGSIHVYNPLGRVQASSAELNGVELVHIGWPVGSLIFRGGSGHNTAGG